MVLELIYSTLRKDLPNPRGAMFFSLQVLKEHKYILKVTGSLHHSVRFVSILLEKMAANLITSYSISMMHIFPCRSISLTEFKVRLVFVDGCFVSEHLDLKNAAPGLVLREKGFQLYNHMFNHQHNKIRMK